MEDVEKVKARCLMRNSTLKEPVILVKSQPTERPGEVQHVAVVHRDHGMVVALSAAAVSLTSAHRRC
jgi:hypothetical protein